MSRQENQEGGRPKFGCVTWGAIAFGGVAVAIVIAQEAQKFIKSPNININIPGIEWLNSFFKADVTSVEGTPQVKHDKECMANVLPLDQTGEAYIVTSKDFPAGTKVIITNVENNKSVGDVTSTGIAPPGYIEGDIFNNNCADISGLVRKNIADPSREYIPIYIDKQK